MTPQKINTAKYRCNEFLAALKALDEAQAKALYEHGGEVFHFSTPKESGIVKRASMELTRALAELRKPR